ncbi:hypothetical protein [Microbulbifer pacificus]|uniref:Zinc ribbon domain-containing protein n=1 Tax=Microbulbifer pacificus TaxID=407164 RepID=A0AAU0N5P9_9GAMM|nr:hypothetical protein [Microbulbifer pacificus]WOX07238.1 hypothetical protein R5R33_08910 [Microbulbifer pacificus]
MKVCKLCKKEIESSAKKCPYCQGYQDWYRNPQILSLIAIVPIMFLWFNYINPFNTENFVDYQEQFSSKQINTVELEGRNGPYFKVTFEVQNNTEYKWGDMSYELIGRNNGTIIIVEPGATFSWVIQPHSSSYISASTPVVPDISSWELVIKDLKTGRRI